MLMQPRTTRAKSTAAQYRETAQMYRHLAFTSPMHLETGAQSRFKKKLSFQKYQPGLLYFPVMNWDGQNAALRWRGAVVHSVYESPEVCCSRCFGSRGYVLLAVAN
jgi:hypothetical protein